MVKPTLAKPYVSQPVSGWLMSEKLDGVRAIWTGSRFISRNGNTFEAPQSVLQQMPAGVVLDGELYAGRGRFERTVGAVRRVRDADWSCLGFHAFDAPMATGGFCERLAYAAQFSGGFITVVDHSECRSADHAAAYMQSIVSAGGEGIMLRDPDMGYVQGRTAHLLKMKPIQQNEAVVVGHRPGAGALRGLLGALICKSGQHVFGVGTGFSDDQRRTPPAIGSTITYSCRGMTAAGLPRHPAFVAQRDYE